MVKERSGSIFGRRSFRNQPGKFSQPRGRAVFIVLALFFTIVLARAVTIHLFPPSSKSLKNIANRQYHRHLELSPYRGTIFDRNKEPLAISIRKPSLFINPRTFAPKRDQIKKLSKILQMDPKVFKRLGRKKSYFSWLKRKISPDAARRVMALSIRGVQKVMEPARFYPAGRAASHTLGFVGIDNQGLMALERRYDDLLKGEVTRVTRSRDGRGRPLFLHSSNAAPEKTGHTLHLTLDRAIQEITEKALHEGLKAAKARGGFAIVSDPHTGRILALASSPGFDPNYRKQIRMQHTRNRALSDVFEPGSVMKPFVIAAALEKKLIRMEDLHNCEKGLYREQRWRIRDSHPYEFLDTAGVIIHSSNIGTFKIARRLGERGLYESLEHFGFTDAANQIDFPGEGRGYIAHWKKWRPIRFANISFGQGMVTTGLEIVQAYGSIANGGKLMKPWIVSHIESPTGDIVTSHNARVVRTTMTPDLARTMRRILQRVVDEGTASKAAMTDFTAGGKTGTTEKVDPETRAYSTDRRIASFVGITPVGDPHLVIYVVVDEPGIKPYYGGLWAAPVFREIASGSLKYLNVAPDKGEHSSSRIMAKPAGGERRL